MKIKRLKSENGVVTVIVALSIVALMMVTALTIDVGSLYEERRFLQTVADAAALAGAQELPESSPNAIQVAINYAASHGVDITSDDVEIKQTYVPEDTITVTPSNPDTPVYFAKVIGIDSVNVNATATATANSPFSMAGLMPWTIALEDYPEGLKSREPLYEMKVGPDSHLTPGFFQAMQFEDGKTGKGADQYNRNIKKGCKQEIFIDQLYPVEPGNMAIPTEEGVISKLGGDVCSFDDVVEFIDGKYYGKVGNCPRIVYIPLIEKRPKNPSEDVRVVGFAIFFIEGVWLERGGKPKTTVTGRFIDSIIATSSGEITGYSGGIKIIRLVK